MASRRSTVGFRIIDLYQDDEGAQEIIKYLQDPTKVVPAKLQYKISTCQLQDEFLFYKNRMYVLTNAKLNMKILQDYHDVPFSGDLAIDRSYKTYRGPSTGLEWQTTSRLSSTHVIYVNATRHPHNPHQDFYNYYQYRPGTEIKS